VNPALVAFAGIATEDGKVTALLLLARLTLNPLLGAAELSVTVQASVPEPVIDALLQEREDKDGGAAVPAPLKLIAADGLEEELLAMVSWPVAEPVAVGSNWTVSVVL
jgi:hypothetical protein